MFGPKSRCLLCSGNLSVAEGFNCCALCQGPVHLECRLKALEKCPGCGGSIPEDLFFAPETPGFDVALLITGGVAMLSVFAGIIVLWQIPFAKEAPGTAGVAFYLVFVPIALAAGFFFALLALLCYLREGARRPRRLD